MKLPAIDTRIVISTIAALLGVFLPVLVLILALTDGASLSETLGTFPNAYVAFLAPTLAGGAVFVALLAILARTERISPRLAVVVLAPTVVFGWVLTGMSGLVAEPNFRVALGCGLIAFGATMWLATTRFRKRPAS